MDTPFTRGSSLRRPMMPCVRNRIKLAKYDTLFQEYATFQAKRSQVNNRVHNRNLLSPKTASRVKRVPSSRKVSNVGNKSSSGDVRAVATGSVHNGRWTTNESERSKDLTRASVFFYPGGPIEVQQKPYIFTGMCFVPNLEERFTAGMEDIYCCFSTVEYLQGRSRAQNWAVGILFLRLCSS